MKRVQVVNNHSGTVFLVFVAYLVYNYNKKCVTYLFSHLIEEFNFTKQNAGTISSAQQLSISLVTFFGGILTDYVSSSLLFPMGLILCGLTTFLFPLGSSVSYFSFVWFLNGIGHGLELPTALRLTKQLSVEGSFATNWSFVLTAVNISGVINPMVSTVLASMFGWRIAVYLSGLITLTTGLVFLHVFNQPVANSGIAHTDKQQTKRGNQSKIDSNTRMIDFMKHPVLWLVILNRFVVAFGRLATSDWTQIYFVSEKGLNQYYGSLFVTTYEFSSIFGKLLSGRLNDNLISKLLPQSKSTLSVRLPISMVFHVISVISLLLYCNYIDSTSSILCLVLVATFAGISSSGNVITLSVLSTEISSKQHEGLVTSICNLAVKVGAFFSGYPFTLVAFWFDWYTSYTLVAGLTLFTLLADVLFHRQASSKHKIE